VARVGDDEPLAWYGSDLATVGAWVVSAGSPLDAIPLALRELGLHLFASSQSSRYTMTETEIALLIEAQRQHRATVEGLSDLIGAGRRLSLARIDWTPSPAELRALLPAPPVGNTVDAATLDLHYAVALGDVASVRVLLEAGADPNALGWEGEFGSHARRPLVLAREGSYDELTRLLLEHGADPLRAWSAAQIFSFATVDPLGLTILRAAWRTSPQTLVDQMRQGLAGALVTLLLDADVPLDDPSLNEQIASILRACGDEACLKRFLARATP
jgi:hypothetical protein